MLIYNCLAQFSSEGFHPATDGNRCRVSEPNITRTLGHPMKEGEEGIGGAREAKDTRIKPTESNNFDSYGFPGTETESLHGTHLGHLHICYICMAGSSCRAPNSGRMGFLWL